MLLALGSVATNAQRFTYKLRNQEDTIQLIVRKNTVVFRVTSRSGIGEAVIHLTDGAWPDGISVEFVDAAEYLEYFLASNGTVQLEGALRSPPRSVMYFDRTGRPVSEKVRAMYAMAIQWKSESRTMQIELPPRFCASPAAALHIEWIDAHR
jgi:hypothetical protein